MQLKANKIVNKEVQNINNSKSSSWGVNASIGSSSDAKKAEDANKGSKLSPWQKGTMGASVSNNESTTSNITYGTIGNGVIVAETIEGNINRDVNKLESEEKTVINHNLNANLQVDNRWLSEEGREEIKSDLNTSIELTKKSGQKIANLTVAGVKVVVNGIQNMSKSDEDRFANNMIKIANNPELLDNPREQIRQQAQEMGREISEAEIDNILEKANRETLEAMKNMLASNKLGFNSGDIQGLNNAVLDNDENPNSMVATSVNGYSVITKMSPEGVEALKEAEGFRGKIYGDTNRNEENNLNGYPTIGWGHKITPEEEASGKFDNGITKEQANNLFNQDIDRFEKRVVNFNKYYYEENGVNLNQHQFDALVSATYNFGEYRLYGDKNNSKEYQFSKILRGAGSNQFPSFEIAFLHSGSAMEKDKQGDFKNKGLLNRRINEFEIWKNANYKYGSDNNTQKDYIAKIQNKYIK